MKKFISAIISSVMLFSSSVYAEPLQSSRWADSQIEEGIKNGWLDKELDPYGYTLKSTAERALDYAFDKESEAAADTGEYITRGELAEDLSAYLPKMDSASEIEFADISLSEYEESIQKCVAAGILKGYEDGTFRPDNFVTNAELSVAVYRLTENKAKALDLFNKINENYKNLKSFTMDLNADMNVSINMDGQEEDNQKMAITGDIKTVINNLEDLDFEMSGNLHMDSNMTDQYLTLYYKDNTYYTKVGDIKMKMEMDLKKAMSEMGINYLYAYENCRDLISSGYVEENSDGTKTIYVNMNLKNMMENISGPMPYDFAVKYDNGICLMTLNADQNNNITDYNIYCEMSSKLEGMGGIGFDMDIQYKMRDLDNTSVNIPEDLSDYKNFQDTLRDMIMTDDEEDEAYSASSAGIIG